MNVGTWPSTNLAKGGLTVNHFARAAGGWFRVAVLATRRGWAPARPRWVMKGCWPGLAVADTAYQGGGPRSGYRSDDAGSTWTPAATGASHAVKGRSTPPTLANADPANERTPS